MKHFAQQTISIVEGSSGTFADALQDADSAIELHADGQGSESLVDRPAITAQGLEILLKDIGIQAQFLFGHLHDPIEDCGIPKKPFLRDFMHILGPQLLDGIGQVILGLENIARNHRF